MAEKKSIHEFSTGTPQAQTAFVVDTPSPSAESGYVTEKVITSDLGNTLLGTLNYTQALETNSKNIFGAINEVKGTVATKQDNMAKGQITNTNLNTLNTNGNYYLAGVSSANNAPTNDFWGMLEVISSVIIIQRATQVGTSGVGANVYERLYISSNWTAWKKIVRTFS